MPLYKALSSPTSSKATGPLIAEANVARPPLGIALPNSATLPPSVGSSILNPSYCLLTAEANSDLFAGSKLSGILITFPSGKVTSFILSV